MSPDCNLTAFQTLTLLPSAMWQTIWTWHLFAFIFCHFFAGVAGLLRFHKSLGKWSWLVPLGFVVYGGLISSVAGLITSVLIAGIYSNAGFAMTTTEVSPSFKYSLHAHLHCLGSRLGAWPVWSLRCLSLLCQLGVTLSSLMHRAHSCDSLLRLVKPKLSGAPNKLRRKAHRLCKIVDSV